MANSRELRDPFTLYYSSEVINDEEFILLYGVFSSKSLNLPYEDYQRFSFDHMKPDECKAEFRFWKNDIPLLADVLQIPADFVCSQGTIFGGLEGLCTLLRRLAYPCRYSDLLQRFGRSVPELSMISNTVMNYIYENHQQRLTNWNQTFLNPAKLEEYAQAISDSMLPWKIVLVSSMGQWGQSVMFKQEICSCENSSEEYWCRADIDRPILSFFIDIFYT